MRAGKMRLTAPLRLNEMETNFPALEKQCDYCNGEGIIDGDTCVVCKGDRQVLTEFGERVADLIDRRINSRLRRI